MYMLYIYTIYILMNKSKYESYNKSLKRLDFHVSFLLCYFTVFATKSNGHVCIYTCFICQLALKVYLYIVVMVTEQS